MPHSFMIMIIEVLCAPYLAFAAGYMQTRGETGDAWLYFIVLAAFGIDFLFRLIGILFPATQNDGESK